MLVLSLSIPNSLAFFWDSEISNGNVFAAGSLDLGFTSTQTTFDPTAIIKGGNSTFFAKVSNLDGLSFKYKLGITDLDPSVELCNNLTLTVWRLHYSSPDNLLADQMYTGSLSSFAVNEAGTDPDMLIPNSYFYVPNTDYLENEHWYKYEVSLPANADPSLGSQTCDFKLTAEAVQTNMDWQNGFWDEESLVTSVSTGSWAKVSGMKWNDTDKDGVKDDGEAGLADWTIFAGKQFDQFGVKSDGTASESKVLETGKTYVIRAAGFIQASTDIRSDAKYASKDPYKDWTDTVKGYEGNGTAFLDLQIDGKTPEWGSYQVDHEYWVSVVGGGNKLTFDINDQVLTENSGQITVTIFETTAQDVTDSSGNYEIDLSSISGDFIVGEVQQAGWTQTFPIKGFYAFNSAAIYENNDFGNVEVPPVPQTVKIVINEVYYDVADISDPKDQDYKGDENSNEWVELYNPNDFAVPLKGWKLYDNAGYEEITANSTIIPAHGFAVIAHDNTTWTKYWNTYGAATENLGGKLPWLNNDGDQLTLKDPQGNTIDFVAWEKGYDDTYPSWIANATEGKSIARQTAGMDSDQPSDWVVLDIPNPGTNPHSHIQVNLNQEGNNLLISFSNATGFDLVKYLITYSHLYSGTYIEEAIEGQKSKSSDEDLLILNPFYMGTCSSLGEVCVPHTGIKDMQIQLEYFEGDTTLGTSTVEYGWK